MDKSKEIRGEMYFVIGRLDAMKHSLFWFLRPPPTGYVHAEKDNLISALRTKAKGLREIADQMDEMAAEWEAADD